MLRHAHISKTDEALERYGGIQNFTINKEVFEWTLTSFQPHIHTERQKLPNTNGLALGVRCRDLDFEVEFPIWTHPCASTMRSLLEGGESMVMVDNWVADTAIVFGDFFPRLEIPERPARLALYRGSEFYGLANTINTPAIVSLVHRIIQPRRLSRPRFVQAVDWPRQCWNQNRSEQVADDQLPARAESNAS